jgi:hypothetical protein
MTIQEQVFQAMLKGPISIQRIMLLTNRTEFQVRGAMGRIRALDGCKIQSHGSQVFTLIEAKILPNHTPLVYAASGPAANQ